MKTLLTFLITLLTGIFIPVSTIAQSIDIGGGQTYAVVVGISNYQDPGIPDLRYADSDAEAFAAYLQSSAGGSLSNDQIVVLTNAKATTAQFSAALDWLIEQSKEGDRAIIYFSGHGDVETKTIANWGFLLTYSSPPTNYIAGAFPIYFLQSVIATLSQKNVKVVMISDACHAGKLAGSEFGGSQATALNLSKQFANEVKIMSCQPDEFSIEGEQWGGGRGAFSYHLVEGLTGMADKDGDGRVKLLEIENYLEEILPKETEQAQIPMTVGNKSSMVALVDEASLTELKERKSIEMPTIAKVETKGFEETVLGKADTTVQELYAAFLNAIEKGDLLEPKGRSANDLYERLILEESLAPLHGFMKRNLAAALHDKAQVAINLYLHTDSLELVKRWNLDSSYFLYPKYLNRAAELLGENHYMYRNLRAKQYYFEGLIVRLEMDKKRRMNNAPVDTILNNKALALQYKALEYETNAAFIYHELANLLGSKGNSKAALEYRQKSAEISPGWALTVWYYGRQLMNNGKTEEAIDVFKKVLKVDPNYYAIFNIYIDLGKAYLKLNRPDEAQIWLDKAVELSPDKLSIYLCFDLGKTCTELNRPDEAQIWFDKAVELSPDKSPILQNIAFFYISLSDCEKAEILGRKLVSFPNLNKQEREQSLFVLGLSLQGQRKDEEALAIFESLVESSSSTMRENYLAYLGLTKIDMGLQEEGLADLENALKKKPDDAGLKIMLGEGYLKLKRHKDAERCFEQALQEARKMDKTRMPYTIYELVWTCADEGETEMALQWLETILQEGYDDYGRLQNDRALADIRKTQKYKDLMKEYFPEMFKD